MLLRLLLLLATNVAIGLLVAIICIAFGVDRRLIHTSTGLDLYQLLIFALLLGFATAFISLLLSKPIARWSTGARRVTAEESDEARRLHATVQTLAAKAGIGMPEIAVYDGEPNAFATGAFRNRALVAVSTGLLSEFRREEIEAVLAHEVAHIANGDMVTTTLLQGLLNAVVIFLARIASYLIDKHVLRSERAGIVYAVVSIVTQLVFGLLASAVVAAHSRRREFKADAGAAALLGSPASMIAALQALSRQDNPAPPDSARTLAINGATRPSFVHWFATHPPIPARIAALQALSARS